MAGVRILLVHPPLLSPVVWRQVAGRLRTAGHDVTVPALRWTDDDRWWDEAASSVSERAGDADAVVAHSGAGALVPVLLAGLPVARAVVLVDAVLPPESGCTTPPEALRRFVADLAVDGVLPPWTSWWGPDAMAELVPDPGDRDDLVSTTPRLRASFLDAAVPAPDGWEPPARAYLQLSDAYDSEAGEARQRGWVVERLDAQHLDLLARPDVVTSAVLRLLPG